MQPEMLFIEVQSFRQPALWIPFIVISIASLSLHLFACQRLPAMLKPALRRFIRIFPIVILGLVATLLLGSRLETEVRPDGLFVQFFPFHFEKQHIELNAVQSIQATEVEPMKMYGGWGLRYGGGGTAYLVNGKKGVRIDYKDGKHLFIGSSREKELVTTIESIWKR